MNSKKRHIKHLSYLVDRKILHAEEEDHYRLDLSAHEKLHIPWLKNVKKKLQPEKEEPKIKEKLKPTPVLKLKKKPAKKIKKPKLSLMERVKLLQSKIPKLHLKERISFKLAMQAIGDRLHALWDKVPVAGIIRFSGVSLGLFALLFTVTNVQAYTKVVMADIIEAREAQRALTEAIYLEPISEDPWTNQVISVASVVETGTLEVLETESLPAEGDYLSFDLTPYSYDNRIIIPSINVNAPIVEPELGYESLEGENWNELEDQIRSSLLSGVVHYPGTAAPGEEGNIFLTAHSSNVFWEPSKYNSVFALVPRLEEGDDIYIHYNQEEYHYRVSFKEEVKPTAVEILSQAENKLSLVTCTPVGTTLNRTVITAYEVETN